MSNRFDLVLFDLGGVIAEIDRDGLVAASERAGVDPRPGMGFWRSAYADGTDEDHPFHKAERGEIGSEEFLSIAGSLAPGSEFVLDAQSPGFLMKFVSPSNGWTAVAEDARTAGIRIGALSNTMDGMSGSDILRVNPPMHAHTQTLFGDDILESHRIRARKPNRAAYIAATDNFDVEPSRVLFIDDEVGNCRGAEAAGMVAIHAETPTAQQDARQMLVG